MTCGPTFGELLRRWRTTRRVSQLDLALRANASARHASFLETGRSRPSREMVLRLAETLDIPLRERDPLLLAAGHAPAFPVRALDDPELTPARAAVDRLLRAYGPYPALAVDRSWNLVAANPAVALFTADVDPDLLAPPLNALRLSLHPRGLAPRIGNLARWRGYVLHRVAREAAATDDPDLLALHAELLGYPGGVEAGPDLDVVVPLRVDAGDVELSLLSTVTVFGTAVDVTMAELSIETFLPADDTTESYLRRHAEQSRST